MSRSKAAYDLFKYESHEFVIYNTVSSNVDAWSPNSKADAKKECHNSITEYFCSLSFRPCTADCSRELKACRSTCMKVLDTCSHASFAYASQGPGSFEREGKTSVGAGITEGLGSFVTFPSRLWLTYAVTTHFSQMKRLVAHNPSSRTTHSMAHAISAIGA